MLWTTAFSVLSGSNDDSKKCELDVRDEENSNRPDPIRHSSKFFRMLFLATISLPHIEISSSQWSSQAQVILSSGSKWTHGSTQTLNSVSLGLKYYLEAILGADYSVSSFQVFLGAIPGANHSVTCSRLFYKSSGPEFPKSSRQADQGLSLPDPSWD